VNSPLGKYSAPTAAILAIGTIAAYVVALLFQHPLGLTNEQLSPLQLLAVAAFGAVFGSAVAVNGYKAPVAALHKRMDLAGIPPAADGDAAPKAS
jgi:hypothetical protein